MAPEYSHEVAVRALTSYYDFLTKLYLNPGTVIKPPSGGWTSISPQSLSLLQKNSAAVRILKEIPYFDQPGGDRVVLAPGTWPVPYYKPEFQALIQDASQREYLTEPVYDVVLSSYAVCLAKGKRDDYYIILDTERGVIVWGKPANPWGNEKNDLTPDDIEPDSPEKWKLSETFEVTKFFDMLKDKFRKLEWMPHPSGATDVYEVDTRDEGNESCETLKLILRDAGWPGDGEAGEWNREVAEQKMLDMEDELEDL